MRLDWAKTTPEGDSWPNFWDTWPAHSMKRQSDLLRHKPEESNYSMTKDGLIWCYYAVLSHSVMSDSLQPARLLSPWGFSRQEYCSGLLCPPPGDLPNPGIEHRSTALQKDSLPSECICVCLVMYTHTHTHTHTHTFVSPTMKHFASVCQAFGWNGIVRKIVYAFISQSQNPPALFSL